MGEKTRYSDEELEEFKQIILGKLDKARKDYELLKDAITQEESNDTQDTSPTFKVLEEGAATLSKEEAGKLADNNNAIDEKAKALNNIGSILLCCKNCFALVKPKAFAAKHEQPHVS